MLLPTVHSATAQPEDLQINDIDSPGVVEVGVWLNGIHDMDFMRGSFSATFYIWWVSEDPAFDAFNSLQVLNGWDWSSRAVNRQTLPDGRYYVAGFVDVTVRHVWNLRLYPFDQAEQSVVSEFAEVPGFRIDRFQIRSITERYDTDFGIAQSSESRFSRLSIEIGLTRESGRTMLALLVGFVVGNIMALLTFAIDRSELATRAGLVTGAIFRRRLAP